MSAPIQYREEVQELFRLGLSVRAIADRLGLQTRTVRKVLKSNAAEDESGGEPPHRTEIRRADEERPCNGPVRVLMRAGQKVNEVIACD